MYDLPNPRKRIFWWLVETFYLLTIIPARYKIEAVEKIKITPLGANPDAGALEKASKWINSGERRTAELQINSRRTIVIMRDENGKLTRSDFYTD